jgi:hypothetical protein
MNRRTFIVAVGSWRITYLIILTESPVILANSFPSALIADNSLSSQLRGISMAPPNKPQVSFVTPSKADTPSYKAFDDEMKRLGWDGIAQWTPTYHADDDATKLQDKVKAAVDNAAAALSAGLQGAVVAGGTKATQIAQDYAYSQHLIDTLPIIQAVGGAVPSGLQPNVTGFLIDDATIGQQHFAWLAGLGMKTVSVLYDAGNPPSAYAYAALQAYQSYHFSSVTLKPIDYAHLGDIQGSFMLLPNATFYYGSKAIADAVDSDVMGSAKVHNAIYPEREFKKGHAQGKRAGKVVHGHDVTLTYRLAAKYVDSILDGTMKVDDLPAFKEAVIDTEL